MIPAALLALAACVGCSRGRASRAQPPVAMEPASSVTLSAAQQAHAELRLVAISPRSMVPRVVAVATIESDADHLSRVGPRVAGRITAVYVRLGSEVRAGAALFDVDTVEFYEAVLAYQVARARVTEAHAARARVERMVPEGAAPGAERERAQANAAAAEAQLVEAIGHLRALGLSGAAVDALQATARAEPRSRVVAPIAGRVTALDLNIGQSVTGSELAVTIVDTARVWLSARVPERDAAALAVGALVEVSVVGRDATEETRLSFVSDLVDPITHTVEVRAPIENVGRTLRLGASATALIALPQGPPALYLPVEAVQTIDGRPSVFVRRDREHFDAVPIEAGPARGGYVPVLRGLTEGQQVVTRGAFTLRGELERAALEEE